MDENVFDDSEGLQRPCVAMLTKSPEREEIPTSSFFYKPLGLQRVNGCVLGFFVPHVP